MENADNNKTEFQIAIDLIRNGDTDNGLQALESIDGQDIMKNLAKAEIAYWRRDWKNAMYLDEHSVSSDSLWMDPFVLPHHLRAYVMAAKEIGAISRAKCFLEYLVDLKKKEYGTSGYKPYNKMFKYANCRLDDQKADDEPDAVRFIEGDESKCQIQMYSMSGPIEPGRESELPIALLLEMTWNKVPTKVVLDLYEKYADYITIDNHHIMAARTYLKIKDYANVEIALLRYLKNWNPKECFQVMPMKLFVYKDLMDYIFESGLSRMILALPKGGAKSYDDNVLVGDTKSDDEINTPI